MACNVRPLRNAQDSRAWPLPLPPSEKALRAAAHAGYEDGERAGYVQGWRWGLVCGAVAGVLVGAAGIVAAIHLGMRLS
jgi:hypothetical protein